MAVVVRPIIGESVAMRRTALVVAAAGLLITGAAAQSTTFGLQQVITTLAGGAWSVYAVDLDGDGDADVLSASPADDKIAWYENQGGGVFGAQQVITTGADDAISVFATDLDGDGDADVLSATQGDSRVAWHENQGGGVFGAQQVISTAASYSTSVYATDLDGDGDADVLSASLGDDKVAWYENLLPPPGGHVSSLSTVYGAGCGSPVMAFAPTSTAILNTSMTGVVTNTPTPLCVVALGYSYTTMPGLGSLPIDLSSTGMAGCYLWQSGDIFGLPTQNIGQAFSVDWALPVPLNFALLGVHAYTQAFSYAPGANSLGVVASNAIDWLIGSQ